MFNKATLALALVVDVCHVFFHLPAVRLLRLMLNIATTWIYWLSLGALHESRGGNKWARVAYCILFFPCNIRTLFSISFFHCNKNNDIVCWFAHVPRSLTTFIASFHNVWAKGLWINSSPVSTRFKNGENYWIHIGSLWTVQLKAAGNEWKRTDKNIVSYPVWHWKSGRKTIFLTSRFPFINDITCCFQLNGPIAYYILCHRRVYYDNLNFFSTFCLQLSLFGLSK